MYDTLYVGGGNTRHIRLELEQNVHIVPNDAGLNGRFGWNKQLDADFAVGG